MKMPRFFVTIIILGTFIAACQVFSISNPAETMGSMKGYELYSWQEADEWYFSVLVGTNREKTLEEIRASGTALKGLEALRDVLQKIPAGQYVTWSTRNGLAFPPDEIVRQVELICKEQGLELGIVK